MVPNLTEPTGITGGFAPPTPSALYTLDKEPSSNNIIIETMLRPDGTPDLEQKPEKTVPINQNAGLIEELHEILKNLPTEQPPGSEDIYGLDTSIAWQSDDLQWWNGGPQGCGGGSSYVKASGEDKRNFERAVEILKQIAE